MQQDRKELGFWMCTALVVGNTIGMGIFVLPASLAPYGFNALLGWGVTVAGMIVLARVFARLAREFPAADGPYTYIARTAGSLPAFIAIWCYWVSCWITNAALAIGLVGYLGKVIPELEGIAPAALAVALIWVFVAVNSFGVRTGGTVQVVTTVLKLLPMFFIVGLGAWLLATEPAAFAQHRPTTPITLEALMAASTIALFAMLGIESATVPAGRVRDPEKNIPRSTIAGTLLMAVIYVAVSAIAMLLLQQDALAKSSAPFADLLDQYVGAGQRPAAVGVRRDQRPRRAERLDAAGQRTDGLARPPRLPPGARAATERAWRAGHRAGTHRRTGQRHGPDELQQVDGGRLHLPVAGGHRGQPAAVPALRRRPGRARAAWRARAGQRPLGARRARHGVHACSRSSVSAASRSSGRWCWAPPACRCTPTCGDGSTPRPALESAGHD